MTAYHLSDLGHHLYLKILSLLLDLQRLPAADQHTILTLVTEQIRKQQDKRHTASA